MDIQSLIGASLRRLAWVGSAQRDYLYELRGDAAVFAIYDGLPDVPACRTAEGEWLFRKGGWVKPEIRISCAGANSIAAVFQSGAFDPTLVLAGGARYEWRFTFMRKEFTIEDEQGVRVLSFEVTQWPTPSRPHVSEAAMEILPGAADREALPLIALMGCYTLLPPVMGLRHN